VDGTASTVQITINGTNDAATVSSDSQTLAETNAPVSTSGALTATDPDDPDNSFTAATITGTIGDFSIDAAGNWTFTANSAFDSLNVGDSVNETFNVSSVDGSPSTVQITINGTNDGPVIDLDSNDSTAAGSDYATTFIEGGSAAYLADADINITDPDSTNLAGATVTINSVESGDLLTVGALPAGITASAYNSATGTITLSGSATLADYQSAIRAIQFSNDGSTTNPNRSIDIVVTDGVNNSNTATADVTIVTLPTISITDVSVQEPAAGTTTLTFTIAIDQTLGSDLTFDYETADISALAGADYIGVSSTVGTITAGNTSTTVTVTINSDANVFEGDETLALNLTNFNQTVNFDPAAHLITGGAQGIGTIGANNGPPDAVDDSYITTIDTPLSITNALANDTLVDNARVDTTGYTDLGGGVYGLTGSNGTVVYDSSDDSFTFTPNAGYTGTAGFSYTLIDDDGETDTANVSVDVSSVVVNPPVVNNIPDTSYTENDAPVSLLSGINITDVDSANLSSVVVTIDGYIGSQDVLAYLTAGTSVVASTTVSGSTWELTLTGGADINEYETVLDSLTYENGSDNPSTAVRTVTVEAYDQSYANLFGTNAGSLSIAAVNDAPEVFDNNVYTLENSLDTGLGITVPTDVDNDDNSLVITITSLPAALGTVTLADGSPLALGQVLTLAELASLEFDAGPAAGTGVFGYTVDDGQDVTAATTTITVGTTNPDIGTVYESGLPDGSGGGSAVVTGNLFANDPSAGSSIDSIDFNAANYTPAGGVITVATALGTLTVYADNSTPGFSAGDYSYTLDTTDGSSNDVDEVFSYNFTNGTAYSDTLTITVVDDMPVANNLAQDVPESEEKIFNLAFTLDDSGSMAWGAETGSNPPGAGEASRMDIAKQALAALATEYFNQSTQVEVTLITFNSTASFVGTYDNFSDFETALNGVTPGGGTNYVDATDEIQTQLATDIGAQNPADDVQNISYFISDGEANAGTSPIGSGYIDFVNSNSIDSYSVGIGSSLPSDLSDLNYIHNIDSLGRGGGNVDDALIVADVSELQAELLSTVPTAFGGSITATGSISNVEFGADGGYVESFTTDIGGTDYTFSYDGSTVTVPPALAATVVVNGSVVELGSDDGFAYGTFTFDFADGSYTMSAPNGIAPAVFEFGYTITDGDGDTAAATATINIIDDAPDARDDLHTMEHWESAAGNVITALGTDGGPQFATSLSPFSSQGGGVDKIVDDAAVSEFTYKGSTISLNPADYTITTNPDPTGTTESVEVDSQANIDASNFSISGLSGGSPTALGFDTGGGSQGVGVGDDRLDPGESLVLDFDSVPLPYGADNLVLTMSSFNGSDAVDITIYAADDTTVLGTLSHDAGSGSTIDLSAYSGIGSIQIDCTSGNGALLRYVDYDPTPSSGDSITPASGDNGSNLSWDFSYETDLDGNGIIQATVTDSNDSSIFVMRSNGFYEYTPDQSGAPAPVTVSESFTDGSADQGVVVTTTANGSPVITYNGGNGIGVNSTGDSYNDSADSGDNIILTLDSGLYPDGIEQITMTFGWDSGTGSAIFYDDLGAVISTVPLTGANTQTFAGITGVSSIEITTGADGDYSLTQLDFTVVPAPSATSTAQEPVLVDYVLTDSDGQSDTARLALYTPDQTLTGAGAPVDVSTATTSQANVDADPNMSINIRAGGSTLEYNADGVGVQGGNGALLSSGEALLVAFSAATAPNGVDNLVLTLNDFQSANNDQATVIVTHDSDGDGNLSTDTVVFSASGSGTEMLDLSAYSGITQFDIEYTGGGWDLGLGNVSYQIPAVASMDNIVGGALNDEIIGGAGDDVLAGGDGHDKLSGGDDNDTLSGDAGNDYLSGGDGADTLSGGSGDDMLTGDAGDDIVDGGSGDDIVLGGDGDDLVFGGSGDDRLEGGDGDDVLAGGAGNDLIFGDDGDDRIVGGSGDDSLIGGGGIDIFALESGDEGSLGSPAVDTISDFAVGVNGDVLDLSDMLQGEDLGSLSNFLSFNYDSGTGDTTVSIDVDGNSGSFEIGQQIVLTGIDLTANNTLSTQDILDNLLGNDNLVVDQ